MRVVHVHLRSGTLVKAFTDVLGKLEGGFEICSGLARLDARSLLGIYSLDLTKPLKLYIEKDSAENLKALTPFLLDDSTAVGF